ncbi:Translation Initiation factor eIF- 4e [Carpediemonas membranifera]|uniref:Translation Initiation factor eIF- 4e n=1 Tax=Carpediemonas membranifera TaxID=201153 RepID=A0A8J6B594_9EUKA|nr:Translation Initiation factor eIF- 4e [Carpediemonas membranifera]|eukprot:KAG9390312.1 Translation Initiation factor eIF- 4e [Carpediemonas membranifera]
MGTKADVEESRFAQGWTLWFDNPSMRRQANVIHTQQQWISNLSAIATFSSIDRFWATYDCICRPGTEMPIGATYYVFRDHCKPTWEDPANRGGGQWFTATDLSFSEEMDHAWLQLVLAIMSQPEKYNADNAIVGVTMQVRSRQGYRLGVWCSGEVDDESLLTAGRLLKRYANYRATMTYQSWMRGGPQLTV